RPATLDEILELRRRRVLAVARPNRYSRKDDDELIRRLGAGRSVEIGVDANVLVSRVERDLLANQIGSRCIARLDARIERRLLIAHLPLEDLEHLVGDSLGRPIVARVRSNATE